MSGDTLTDFVVEQGAPFLSKNPHYWQQFSDEMSEVMNGTSVDTELVRRRIDYQFDDIAEWDEVSRTPGETETTVTHGDGSIKGWILDDESAVIGEISGHCRFVDNSTTETRRYADGRIVRVERDGEGVVTCTAAIDEHSDGSRIENLSYPNGVQLRRAYDENGALIAQDVAGSRWQTDPAAIESLAAGDSLLAFAAFTAALRLKTEDSLLLVRSAFGRAASVSSPLILDLDGDGVETTGRAQGIYFDHDGNGFAQSSGWVARDDGLLVNDVDGDGQIRSGAELFGNETPLADGNNAANGFAALRALDSNNDGVIDAADAAYARLRVWKDADTDAVADEGELVTLAAAGVASIGLAFVESSSIDGQGNAHRQVGQWTRGDGTMAEMTDVWFGEDRARTLNMVQTEVPVALWALPDLAGFGNVADLHEAMARDTSGRLAATLRAFLGEADEGVRRALAENLVLQWAGTDSVAPGSRGAYVDARALAALERFSGEAFAQPGWGANPGQTSGKRLMEGFRALVEQMGARLDAQTQLSSLYQDAVLLRESPEAAYRLDLTLVGNRLHASLEGDPEAGLALLDAFARNLNVIGYGDEVAWRSLAQGLAGSAADPEVSETLRRALLNTRAGTRGDDMVTGTVDADRLLGFSGDDALSGKDGDDVIEGGCGNDSLEGGAGNDLLVGGAGDDMLNGGSGNDVYVFERGAGRDLIRQYDATSGHIDVARFSAYRPSDLQAILRTGDDLLLDFGSGDSLSVSAYFDAAPRRVEFEFADGERWGDAAVKARTKTRGTGGADLLSGYYGASNVVDGLGGNDTLNGGDQADDLSGGDGDDLLYGRSGNDLLLGEAGADTLSGGTGDDVLAGGAGDDVYTTSGNDLILFNAGDGQDRLAAGSSGKGTLSLGGHFSYSDLALSRANNDLVLSMSDADQIAFADWYAATPSRPVLDLQVIVEAMEGFSAGGSDPLLDQKVETFNFTGLVGAFDAARTADTSLSRWQLNEALANFHLSGADSAALGGDLAYQYGRRGSLGEVGLTVEQGLIGAANFGHQPQALQTGVMRLA